MLEQGNISQDNNLSGLSRSPFKIIVLLISLLLLFTAGLLIGFLVGRQAVSVEETEPTKMLEDQSVSLEEEQVSFGVKQFVSNVLPVSFNYPEHWEVKKRDENSHSFINASGEEELVFVECAPEERLEDCVDSTELIQYRAELDEKYGNGKGLYYLEDLVDTHNEMGFGNYLQGLVNDFVAGGAAFEFDSCTSESECVRVVADFVFGELFLIFPLYDESEGYTPEYRTILDSFDGGAA